MGVGGRGVGRSEQGALQAGRPRGGSLRILRFFRVFETYGLDLNEFLGGERFAPFQFGNQALVEGEQFFQPPICAGGELAALEIEAFEQELADDLKAGVMRQGIEGIHFERPPDWRERRVESTVRGHPRR